MIVFTLSDLKAIRDQKSWMLNGYNFIESPIGDSIEFDGSVYIRSWIGPRHGNTTIHESLQAAIDAPAPPELTSETF